MIVLLINITQKNLFLGSIFTAVHRTDVGPDGGRGRGVLGEREVPK